ncbi:hypothetical protein OKZ62_001861 [Vibrio navarrensis]|nr:hypothetical protein [Vibrio navarrensis]
MKKNLIVLALFAAGIAGISLDLPQYVIGGIAVGFSLRWFAYVAEELNTKRLQDKAISVVGYSLMLVLAGGIFNMDEDASYMTILTMLACAAAGIVLAEIIKFGLTRDKQESI